MQNVREKLRRKLSHRDEAANIDEHEDIDEETTGHLHKQIEEAEEDEKYPQGRPGSFLNRLISHGNKKTEDQLAAEAASAQKGAVGASATNTATEATR
ncbi:hypothetical protein AAFC00_006964 [Neodothiora populina]|uniref:Uncharacterized protein n=1 Tax=Neodothiora populina TaxID=2781224 RepID=A0ABR3PBR4_9PEZI